jgi:hypothetical protein
MDGKKAIKKKRTLWLGVCAGLCMAGCSGTPAERAGYGEGGAGTVESVSGLPAEGALPGKKPEGPSFTERPPQGLPPEARAYLESLSAAFRSGDRDFLLAQGEAHFEAEVRPFHDGESYLALLYRIDPYDKNGFRTDTRIPRLNPEEIIRLEYAEWEEQGPLLEIRGRLVRRGGPPLPCLIMLVWKLREPKIQGRFP